jgi:hypothetical protein
MIDWRRLSQKTFSFGYIRLGGAALHRKPAVIHDARRYIVRRCFVYVEEMWVKMQMHLT